MTLRERIRRAADELRHRLGESADRLDWDEQVLEKAEQARYNGGTREQPRPRQGIPAAAWREATNQTRWDFDRMRFIALTPLAAAWVHTREADYGQAARDYIAGWIDSHPRPEDDDRLNTAIRINLHGPQGWLGTLPYFLDHPAFDDALLERIIATVQRDLNWMAKACASTANVRLFQADSLLWAALRLPWLPDATPWRTLGVRMLNDAFFRMVAPDGSNVEKDPHYVGVYTAIYGQAVSWAKALPELGLCIDVEPVARLFDYALCGTKPNGHEVGLHDSVSDWTGRRDNLALKRRADFRRSVGLDPDLMPPTSACFPDAGQVFMRTRWGEDAEMMIFDATRRMTAHNHLSFGSVQLHAFGRTLLMDPGFLTYRMGHLGGNPLDQVAGPHGKSTRAHNTVNLNGWNQFMVSPESL